jgi:hypothetical protein
MQRFQPRSFAMTFQTTRLRFSILAVVAFVSILAPTWDRALNADETVAAVLKVWQAREQATRSFRCEMSGEFLTGKGSIISTLEGGGVEHAITEPRSDMKANQRSLLVVDGSSMRYERQGMEWADAIKDTAPQTMISTFDGRQSKQLFKRDREDDLVHSRAFVNNNGKHPEAHNLYLSPIIRHFRPISSDFGVIHPTQLVSAGPDEVVRGLKCHVLKDPNSDNLRSCKFWVASEQGMAIVRYVSYFQDRVENQAEITFRKDDILGWIPAKWSAVRMGGKGAQVLDSCAMVLERCEVNLAVPAGTFDVAFPAGTEVIDYPKRKTFLVKPGGSWREIQEIERQRKASHSQLMATTSGEAAVPKGPPPSTGYLWIIVASVAVAACAIVLMFLRNRTSAFQ